MNDAKFTMIKTVLHRLKLSFWVDSFCAPDAM